MSCMIRTALVVSLFVSSTVFAGGDRPHAGDVFLWVEENTIVTGLFDKNTNEATPKQVFAAEFGDTGFDGFTAEPGFDSLLGTFPEGSKIGFKVLDGWKVWNGSGFEAAGTEGLSISFDALEVVVGDKPVDGFELNVQPGGVWHIHYNYFVFDPTDESVDPGVYLLNLRLSSTAPSLDPTEPFWIVFNYKASEEDHDAAIGWAEANLVSPSCLGDLSADGLVDGADLGLLLSLWGDDDALADLDQDGAVDGADLGLLLSLWGSRCS